MSTIVSKATSAHQSVRSGEINRPAYTIGSLCTGMGGLEAAVEQAFGPGRRLWHAEKDPAASTVLAAHHPGVPNHGDILTTDWAQVERPDILAAGFPCQPASAAGRQLGEQDERWLWSRPDGTGVLNAIRALTPPTVVLENVANLVSIQGGRLFQAILDDLHDAGYQVRWVILGACTVGACHHRHRVFLLARHVGTGTDWRTAVQLRVPRCGFQQHLLPTPVARDGEGRGEGGEEYWARKREQGWDKGMPLGAAVALLPTPTAAEATGAGSSGRDGGANLRTAVTLLPTPGARLGDDRGAPSPETAQDRMDSGRRNLDDAVALLPTPRATDGVKGGPNQRGSRGDLALPAAVQDDRWGRYTEAVHRWAAIGGAPPRTGRAEQQRRASPHGAVSGVDAWPAGGLGHRSGRTQRRIEDHRQRCHAPAGGCGTATAGPGRGRTGGPARDARGGSLMTAPTRTTQPNWDDRCTCTHVASSHGPLHGWSPRGACLRKCGCKQFQAAGVAK